MVEKKSGGVANTQPINQRTTQPHPPENIILFWKEKVVKHHWKVVRRIKSRKENGARKEEMNG